MVKKRYLVSGGGTGGHIYPAIAIAQELKKRNPYAEFLFIGAQGRMEMEKVPQFGFPIKGLWITGIKRELSFANLLFPVKFIFSLFQASWFIIRFKPQLAIGTGGFASGSALKVASWLGIPYVLQEQNSYAGITNKWLAKKAKKIFVAFDAMNNFFPADKIVLTGNPIRTDILTSEVSKNQAITHFKLDNKKFTLLVLGGSLGARKVNQLIEQNLDFFEKAEVQLIWQCGSLYAADYGIHDSPNIRVLSFIKEMDMAYAAADLIISRAGAGSISELAVVGKAVVFIPSPNVAENHQVKNASAIVAEDAAVLIEEKDLELRFRSVINDLLQNVKKRQLLGANFSKLARPNATQQIVNQIVQL